MKPTAKKTEVPRGWLITAAIAGALLALIFQ